MEKVKKIVLIGASGFVGSALLNEALNRGFEVTAVVRHPEKIKIENENLKVVKADVSALDEVAGGESLFWRIQAREEKMGKKMSFCSQSGAKIMYNKKGAENGPHQF